MVCVSAFNHDQNVCVFSCNILPIFYERQIIFLLLLLLLNGCQRTFSLSRSEESQVREVWQAYIQSVIHPLLIQSIIQLVNQRTNLSVGLQPLVSNSHSSPQK